MEEWCCWEDCNCYHKCAGSWWVVRSGDSGALKGEPEEAPCDALFFVGEAETDWDFGFPMGLSALLSPARFSFFDFFLLLLLRLPL